MINLNNILKEFSIYDLDFLHKQWELCIKEIANNIGQHENYIKKTIYKAIDSWLGGDAKKLTNIYTLEQYKPYIAYASAAYARYHRNPSYGLYRGLCIDPIEDKEIYREIKTIKRNDTIVLSAKHNMLQSFSDEWSVAKHFARISGASYGSIGLIVAYSQLREVVNNKNVVFFYDMFDQIEPEWHFKYREEWEIVCDVNKMKHGKIFEIYIKTYGGWEEIGSKSPASAIRSYKKKNMI